MNKPKRPSLKRTMRVIDVLCSLYNNLDQDVDKAEQFIEMIYSFVHVAHGHCENQHYDWRDDFYKTEKQLIDMGELK